MSRKWERMVIKNTKAINKGRTKQGKPILSETAKDERIFKGRSVMYTLLLIGVSVFMLVTQPASGQNTLYWFTVISYFLLGLMIFFARRPFLNIGKNQISTRKLTGNKYMHASDIKLISLMDGYVMIDFNGKQSRWVFSRLLNRFDTAAMGEQLKIFAQHNQVALKDETKA